MLELHGQDGARSWVYALVMELGLLPSPAAVDHVGALCGRSHACRWRINTRDGTRYVFGGPTSESGLRAALSYLEGLADPTTRPDIVIDALELHPSHGRYA